MSAPFVARVPRWNARPMGLRRLGAFGRDAAGRGVYAVQCTLVGAALLAACADASPTSPASPGPLPPPTAAGAPNGAAAFATIGPAGGTLTSPDGRLAVEVPPGAVAAPTAFSVQPLENTAPGGAGAAYRLLPHGTAFATPVRVTFRYGADDVRGSAPRLLRPAYQDDAGRWRRYRRAALDTARREVRVETRHFSDWSLVPGAQLRPHEATVQVGASAELLVRDCQQDVHDDGQDVVLSILYACREYGVYSITARGWAVNGVAGGAPETGAVVETAKGQARYTAPPRVPAANPVAVSVRYTGLDPEDSGLLVANVTVFDPHAPSDRCAHLPDAEVWNATFGLAYEFAGANADGRQLAVAHFAEVTARLRRSRTGSPSPTSRNWVGPVTGGVRVDDRRTSKGGRVRTVRGAGVPVSTAVAGGLDLSRAYLNVDLATCRYNVGMTAAVEAVHADGGGEQRADTPVGSVRSDWRPVGGTHLAGGGEFPAHSAVWGASHVGDAYFPDALGAELFVDGYAAEGQAGAARVSWSLAPEKSTRASAAPTTPATARAAVARRGP